MFYDPKPPADEEAKEALCDIMLETFAGYGAGVCAMSSGAFFHLHRMLETIATSLKVHLEVPPKKWKRESVFSPAQEKGELWRPGTFARTTPPFRRPLQLRRVCIVLCPRLRIWTGG